MTNTNVKFTATLVTEDTKNTVVALRNEVQLSEKELMTLIVATAIKYKADIIAAAAELVAQNEIAKANRKQQAYAALKAKMQEIRASKPKKEKAPAKPAKPAKAPKTAAIAA
jgi:hypothetical protein